MDIQQAFDVLKAHFKTHSAAARHVKKSPEHYRAMRNGRAPIPEDTADHIITKAEKIQGDTFCPHPAAPEGNEEARG